MLKYSIKLNDNNIEQEKMVWSEKYLSPDLSFVNGVTSTNYHLEKYKRLPVSNGQTSTSTVLVDSKNVTRQGYIVIKNKEYEVQSGSIIDYSVEPSGNIINYEYLFINGKYYYLNDDKFIIDNWLTEHFTSYTDSYGDIIYKPYITEDEKIINFSNGNVSADTIIWIEDGIVTIDGYDYIFDKDIQINSNQTSGGLKYYEDGDCLPYSAITKCSDIQLKPFESINDYIDVTKFTLRKENNNIGEPFERISFCTSYYYVNYKDHYYSVMESGDTNGNYDFICRIPSGDTSHEDFLLYYSIDGDAESEIVIDNTTFSGHGVHDLHDLYKVNSFIKIDNTRLYVNRDIMNSNDGRQIAVYLDDEQNAINIGEKLIFSDEGSIESLQDVYSDDGGSFVIFNSQKYRVIDNLCDKAIIIDNEYRIDYINGKLDGKDCLVLIGDEEVPMKIVKEGDNFKLNRYGNIVVEASGASSAVSYDIKPYSGITVDGKKYIINDDGINPYVMLDKSNQFTFVVREIKGNSMLICDLDINMTDFNDEFRTLITEESCRYVVEHQDTIQLSLKNKIFGDKEITKELAFQATTTPISSDDYYNLLDNLDIYTKNAYIQLPMMLTSQQGNNLLQDDLVEDQFFRVEKEKAINPIIDMEKEVYYPKFISNKWTDDDKEKHQYSGSNTDFITLEELRFNLHFRTRNLDSWKVNDGYNNVATSGKADNWFVTDFHPYCDILSDGSDEEKNNLMNSSDLLGLLYFSNDDVYYQKKKIAKSFLRLTFYDSTDQETQNLLATSTIFMDEHKLFKKFIDNSRKYVSQFGMYEEPDKVSGMTSNKISVKTEYLGTNKEANPTDYIDNFVGVKINDEHRLGSEFIVNNKFQSETSSEGFYLYMFKEYSEKLHPKPIYMKVEFNHAGIGRTIPFIIPMKWGELDDNGNKYPKNALKLTDDTERNTLKEGIKLGDVYAQSYIPLYAVYDFKNKQYAYVFDDRYVQTSVIGDKEGVILNLYEMKIMEENDTSEIIQEKITYKKQETAIIDFNEKMFPKEANEQA